MFHATPLGDVRMRGSERLNTMNQSKIIMAIAAGMGALAAYVESWTGQIWTLLIIMGIDFVIGIAMPLFFRKSKKSKAGKIDSYTCRRGIIKKCVIFLMIYVAFLLGKATQMSFLPDAVCTAFIVSEVISILEHAAVLGVPIPKVLLRALAAINDKAGASVNILANGGEETPRRRSTDIIPQPDDNKEDNKNI